MITGQVYLQNYRKPQNNFAEFGTDKSGVYLAFQDGRAFPSPTFEQGKFSGLYIPDLAADKIYNSRLLIGQSNYLFDNDSSTSILIGKNNAVLTTAEIRTTGDVGEYIIGHGNTSSSGVANNLIGIYNESFLNYGAYTYGIDNVIRNSYYQTSVGSANYVSGIYDSNIFGRGNILFAQYEDDINGNVRFNPKYLTAFSGYVSRNTTILGSNNFCTSGIKFVTCVGDMNSLTRTQNSAIFGYYHNIYRTSGENLIVGTRNDATRVANVNLIGLENESSASNRDFVVGMYNVNEGASRSFTFGETNRMLSGANNFIVGNFNDLTSSNETIIGNSNTTSFRAYQNSIFGSTNTLSGSNNNLIVGKLNSIDDTVVRDIYGISLYKGAILPFDLLNYYEGYGADFDPTAKFGSLPFSGLDVDSYNNGFFGSSNAAFYTSNSYIFGASNKSIDNIYSNIFGTSNKAISTSDSTIIGKDNLLSGASKTYMLGQNNSITLNESGIFIGFNFKSVNGNVSGIGINITPTGINLYGALRMNGVRMNVP